MTTIRSTQKSKPNTNFLKGFIDLDKDGYVVDCAAKTSADGVYAAGNCCLRMNTSIQ